MSLEGNGLRKVGGSTQSTQTMLHSLATLSIDIPLIAFEVDESMNARVFEVSEWSKRREE